MSDYIDREAVIAALAPAYGGVEDYVRKVIGKIPAADVAQVKREKWGKRKDRDTIKCSSCGFQMFPLDAYQKGEWPNMCVTFRDEQKYIPRFCPDCGARMDA